jgi:hypothetical protein
MWAATMLIEEWEGGVVANVNIFRSVYRQIYLARIVYNQFITNENSTCSLLSV